MEHKTDLKGVSIWDKLRQLIRSNRLIIELLGTACTGFIMANSFVLGEAAPFGVAFGASLSGKYSLCGALGALLGYVLTPRLPENIKYIAALLLVAAIKWVSEEKLDKSSTSARCVGTALAAMLTASIITLAVIDFTMYDVAISLSEVFLASGSAYFFSKGFGVLKKGFAASSRTELSCGIISGGVMLMGMSGLNIGGLSAGKICAVLIILFCARYGGEAAGVISGLITGIAIGIAGKDFSYVTTAYALGGLAAGMFGHTSRLLAASAFVIANGVAALFVTTDVDVFNAVFEIFAASAIFMAIPSKVIRKWKLPGKGNADDNSAQYMLRGKLAGISRVLKEISDTTHKVSEGLSKLETPSMDKLHSQVADKVCKHCGNRTSCWQFSYNDTMAAMSEGVRLLKRDGSLNRENSPRHFTRTCCKLDMLLNEMNTVFRDYIAREGVQRKVSQVRSVVTDQFEGMAMMLGGISRELSTASMAEPQKLEKIREYFRGEHYHYENVLCYSDEYNRMHVELVIPTYQLARLDKENVTLDLSSLLETDLDLPRITVTNKSTEICFYEKAALTVTLGAYQLPGGGSRICGDAYDHIQEQGGKTHIILSDGMGSGGAAAVDASMASGLLTRLLSVGVEHEAALKMVNSALLIKSGEESLATIDICTVDLFTGEADFYKAGAAPSYILRNGRGGCIDSTSLPAGILRGVAFEKSSVSLREGDLVVLISDGVIATGVEWVSTELEHLYQSLDIKRSGNVQKLCERLAMTSQMRREDGREDDITVVAALLNKGI